MRVALDQSPLTLSSGGLKRYVEELRAALTAAFPEDEYLYLPPPTTFLRKRWWLYGAERACAQAQVDLFHGTNFAIPFFTRRPTVLTLHDLSPWRSRAWHRSKGARTIRRRTPYLIPRATQIVTPSEAIRREAIAHFRISPDRITAIPLAASPLFRPVPQPVTEPYFLFVGTQEPRKGIVRLLEVWRNTAPEIAMKLVGRRREDFPPIPPEPNLQQLGELPDTELPALYTNALAVFYPSEYEGFGLPVLEAMQCGATVITSNDPALRELTSGAALHTDHLAEAFRAIPNLRDAALKRAAHFSWERTAAATRAVYRKALGLPS